ncbi:hypothetical protein PVK06_017134 [Gossypium arboreum]|uniref:Uncharacterized protein n=1 Tax=Gossypium arboreum TaxID=29729 RepID=A0ABR0Q2B4_GOSAR|nr:hypothetical protein PVK06_017134 [Gossypium arboreum]
MTNRISCSPLGFFPLFAYLILGIEKVEIVLTGLPSDFDGVITLASFSSEPLLFQCLVDILLEFESRQSRAATETPFHANLVAFAPTPLVTD